MKKQVRQPRPGGGGEGSPKDTVLIPSYRMQWMGKELTSRSNVHGAEFLISKLERVSGCPMVSYPRSCCLVEPRPALGEAGGHLPYPSLPCFYLRDGITELEGKRRKKHIKEFSGGF